MTVTGEALLQPGDVIEVKRLRLEGPAAWRGRRAPPAKPDEHWPGQQLGAEHDEGCIHKPQSCRGWQRRNRASSVNGEA